MGQKINPISLRIGINTNWRSRWYKEKGYANSIRDDFLIRDLLKKKLSDCGVAKIEIERSQGDTTVIIHTAKPGIVIGRGGSGTAELKKAIEDKVASKVKIDIVEIRQPESNAQIVADTIKTQIEKRIAYKRAMKQAVEKAIAAKVKGIKIQVSGRLGGAEIARSEKLSRGSVPLTTLRSEIDYGFAESKTTYGTIGIKVWIFKGEKQELDIERPVSRRV